MKKVEAFIQPFMLSHVLKELRDLHAHGLTVTDVRGFGRQKDESYPHHTADYAVDFTPKTRLEILCRDEDAEGYVEAILRSAHTGRRGDGKVFVSDIERVVSIRLKAVDEEAL
jgi:nitrogen regulatory protein P-II 1